MLPQFSSVDETLKSAQRYFYALNMISGKTVDLITKGNLDKLEVSMATPSYAINSVCSSYIEAEHRLRESGPGPKVVTFAQVLKYNRFPLAEVVSELLGICKKGMGCPVEIEFAVDLREPPLKDTLYLLQIRPMVIGVEREDVYLTEAEIVNALCYSEQTLGHGIETDIKDLIMVKREGFSPSKTRTIAVEIGKINSYLSNRGQKYILVGPGRWGSADPLLGIPVQWRDISNVGAIVELVDDQLKVESSQGTHFFQNITSLNIFYLTVRGGRSPDRFDWKQASGLSIVSENDYLLHVQTKQHFLVKVNGKSSCGSITQAASK